MSALNQLPPDLIEAILSFLPPKSLGRFKSVSKRWYSLISSPSFIKTHIQNFTKNNLNSNPTLLILIPEYGYSLYSLDIKQFKTLTTPATVTAKRMNFEQPWFEISGSCNGLLLTNDMYHDIYLFNPTTGKTLKVLGGESNDETYGFGYDFSTDDYKIISISQTNVSDSDPDRIFARVYSLRKNSWRKLPNLPYLQSDIYDLRPGVLLNSNLHWVVTSKHSTLTIAAFSLANEEFHEIKLPYSLNNDGSKFFYLFAVGGKLVAVLRNELLSFEFFYELWVMEEYGIPKSWKKFSIFQNDMDLWYEFIAQVNNRDILLGTNDANQIFIYNMDEKRYTSVTIEGHQGGHERLGVYGTYVESLESLERFH